MKTGKEGLVDNFPTPDELWQVVHEEQNIWRDKFNDIPYEDLGGTKPLRFYQEIAVNNALPAIADNKDKILLTLATGTGKTFIIAAILCALFDA